MDRSHFVPYQIVNTIDGQRSGRPYSDQTNLRIEKVMDSSYNTSDATAAWNRGLNKRHENQLTAYARGDRSWSSLSDGAKNRYNQQASAWKDIRTDCKATAPGLAKSLDQFYSRQQAIEYCCL